MPNNYIAPYLISTETVTLPDGEFTIPICTTRERFDKIMNALWGWGALQGTNFDFDHLIDFLDALPRITEGCIELHSQCRTISLDDDRITWFPESPFHPNPEVPEGYPYHPFTVVSGSMLDGIISVWGLGYKIGDVFTDLTKLPVFTNWFDILANYGNMPSLTINNLSGAGLVKIHLLNIIQGSRILVLVDGHIDVLNLRTIEVGRDAVSFPPETNVDFVAEVEVNGAGTHSVTFVWYPTVDVSAIPISFGGGVRSVELCGFEDIPMDDPCCPETNNILTEILNLLKGGATIKFEGLTQGGDFTVDCAPTDFDGEPSDEPVETLRWVNALCKTIVEWTVAALYIQASRMNETSKLNDILALGGLAAPPTFTAQMEYVNPEFTVNQLNEILASDNGFTVAVCELKNELISRANTFSEFKLATQAAHANLIDSEDSGADLTSFIYYRYSLSRVNYAAFARALERNFDLITEGEDYTCMCDAGTCDPDQFVIIAMNDCLITKIGVATWRVQQNNYTIPDPVNNPEIRSYDVKFRDQFWRCFNVYTYSEGMSGHDQYDCEGDHINGVGGGGGNGVQFWFQHRQNADYHAIDATMTLLCPD